MRAKKGEQKFNGNHKSPLKISFLLLVASWTVIIVGIIFWSYSSTVSETEVLALKEAYKGFEKDVVYRNWASGHGGVYVPISDSTPPNIYLGNIPERDISTSSGKKLTLINPAYMTRQVHEISKNKYGIIGHITSLNPIRKENAPDDWERKALNHFEKGEKEYYGFDTLDGELVYRYMGALIAEKGCLKCHASQGYKVGDIRGGISSTVSWKNYNHAITKQMTKITIGYGILWTLGLVGLMIVMKNFSIYISRRDYIENELKKLNEDLLASKAIIENNLQQNNKLIEELNVAKEELVQLNNTKDKFFSIIAHDLKSPFQGFLGLTAMLVNEKEKFSAEEEKLLIQNMHASAKNLFDLLTNLLSWAKMQQGSINYNPKALDVGSVADNIIDVITPRCDQKGINISREYTGPLVAWADENMIKSVFTNLISNAVKFTKRDGAVIIKASEIGNNMIQVSVSDNGVGIRKVELEKLFKMGEKIGHIGTDGEESTGLGLLLCKEFVEKNGGKIWVESEIDKGSTFYFTVPSLQYNSMKRKI